MLSQEHIHSFVNPTPPKGLAQEHRQIEQCGREAEEEDGMEAKEE
jgi:hypothetical protein